MNEVRYTIPQHVVILPEITTECNQSRMSLWDVKKLLHKDKDRYIVIQFQKRNGATYIYDKVENSIVGRIDRRLINEMDVEIIGSRLQCYRFV